MPTNNVLDLIGNTPIINMEPSTGLKIFAKAEFLNPGGSIKDRVAKHMLEAAEKEGKLKKGMHIIEPTSGNTGIGLALCGVQMGYDVTIVMPENMSTERRAVIKALGKAEASAAIKTLKNAAEAFAKNKAVQAGGNVGQEYAEEFIQEILSQANAQRCARGEYDSGIMGLLKEAVGIAKDYVGVAAEQGLPSGGLFFTIMAVVILLTRLFAGKVTDKHSEVFFAYTCNLAMLAAFLLMGLVPGTVTYLLAAVLSGFGFGGLEPALQSMAVAIAPSERRGSANSTFLCAYDIGIGVGGGIAGSLISGLGYGMMFLLMSAFNILAILIYHFWARKHPSSFSYRRQHGQTAQE